ncbi:MAG: hypothetical protein US57_C0006G0079 [Candidatus Moranbacteria bacterium GW2011_GWC2_37_73]|nr:MAG: hypothetical protein UR95_C0007G0082 [Parcubacteria group bacterium GW2011_GWC1_36_108]KKQ00129.1 MAG: hypothetical protein US09_C0020G0011 [Candidatus Moranbacteria bacterium GW2011_GWD1_36_198]KKQ01300.1 MAG: hypothetical protein US10_C0019G0011 [Candidatus Moranbacteria bacterium GW2011_GWD2_36_198]KKQ40007.1 MAG: hypothetical protein US57_C0006G0079 [Candidatus Moranbacteria bacterium GW2011_GWC2_37_73]HAS00229.1 hypothetical protein [Candidatus Moranbacteria bacterium]
MFSLSPDIEIGAMLFLIGIAFICSLVYAFFAKEKIKALVVFSVLSNMILWLFILIGSRLFYFYDILWFRVFSVFFWPVINIYLIIKVFSKK